MRARLIPFVMALTLVVGFSGASGFVDRSSADPSRLGETFDARTGLPGIGPTKPQVHAIVSLVREHADVKLEWNAPFGTPSSIQRLGTTLSEARAGAPASIARGWLARHAGVFGWNDAGVAALSVQKTLTQPRGGARIVLFHQLFGGRHGGSFGGSIVVALDRANRILSVRANVVRTPRLARDSGVSARRALEIAAHSRGFEQIGSRAGWAVFSRGAFAGSHYVQPIAFPTGNAPARPAWEVIFVKRLYQGYRTVVDASTGEVLYRYQMAQYEAPEGRVFDYYPGAPRGGTHELRSFKGDPKASPQGWLFLPPGVSSPATIGNNATTATNWLAFIAPDGPGQIRALSPTGVFDFPFADAWNASDCGANPISTANDPRSGQPLGTPDTPVYAQDALPAVVSLFYHHNVMHDYFYNFGFNEEAGAMQVSNFGKTGSNLENDPLFGLVQAGALGGDAPAYLGRDNAYMFPFPDGLPQWSGMFIWEPIPGAFIAPCVDGDFSADVIYHEYTHGVTSRWVGGEFGNLASFQGGSMGEAWSDFYALHYLFERGLETKDILGLYVTPDKKSGIRNWALGSVPVGLGDLGYDMTGEEVHADGEIWAGVLWDIRTVLKAARAHGANLAAQLVADAMPISGPNPSMVNMRNAILAADVARTKGANQSLLWSVFAGHGMGVGASSPTPFEVNPIPSFAVPAAEKNATVSGRILDIAGKGISDVRILISPFEARVSPVARSASDGSFAFKLQAGTYPVTMQAPGYGTSTFTLTVPAGGTVTRQVTLGVNYASRYAGASIASTTNTAKLGPALYAIDDTAATSWWTDQDTDGPAGESFVVDLAGSKPVTISSVRLSAYSAPGGSRFEAVKTWKLLSSLDGKTFKQIATDTIKASEVRPKAPDLNYRTISLASPVAAKFVKFVADPQDPDASSVQIGDLQVFGAGGKVKVTKPVIDTTTVFHDEGMILVPSPAANLTFEVMSAGGPCVFPPPTQGIDAWVSELPDGFGDTNHTIDVGLTTLLPDPIPDVDLFFLSADCVPTGDIASSSPHESGTIPQGSKYVVSSLFTALPAQVTVEAKGVKDLLPRLPRVKGRKTLPGTGVPSGVPLGLTLIAAAVAIYVLRRPRGRLGRN